MTINAMIHMAGAVALTASISCGVLLRSGLQEARQNLEEAQKRIEVLSLEAQAAGAAFKSLEMSRQKALARERKNERELCEIIADNPDDDEYFDRLGRLLKTAGGNAGASGSPAGKLPAPGGE